MQYKIIDEDSAQYKQDIQRLQSLRTQIVLWLVVLALGIAIIPLMSISGWIRDDVARLETEILTVQSALNGATTPSSEVVKLTNDITNINLLITSFQTVTIPSGINWPQIVDAVMLYDPATIEIDSLTQTDYEVALSNTVTVPSRPQLGKKLFDPLSPSQKQGNRPLRYLNYKIQIKGRASNNDAVVRYQQNLFVTGTFQDVVVLSMSTLPAPPPTSETTDETATIPVSRPFGSIEFVIDLVIGVVAS